MPARKTLARMSHSCNSESMFVCTFLNNKGGVGKSTAAVEKASYLNELGSSVLVIDADSSEDCAKHLQAATTDIPVRKWTNAHEIRDGMANLPSGCDFVVADSPSNCHAEAVALLEHSDVVLIPTEPSLKSIVGSLATYDLAQEVRKRTGDKPTQVYIFFNKVDMRRKKKNREWRSVLEERNIPMLNSYLRKKIKVFEDAEELETTVGRMKHTRDTLEAQTDLAAVFGEVLQNILKQKVANG